MTRLLPATLAGLMFGSMLFAADISGAWTGNLGGPVYIVFKQEGSRLSGSGGQNPADQILTFDNGKVEGDQVTFKVGPFAFDLHIEGESLRGQATNGERTLPVFFKRAKTRPAGAPLPVFEVASVKQVQPPPPGRGVSSSMRMDPGRFICTNVTLKKLIFNAYGVKDYEVTGPDWLNTELYDIAASVPTDTAGDDVLLMMQSLLAERFKLALHRERKEMPVFALIVGKTGPKLKQVEFGPSRTSASPGKLTATNVPMRNLAEFLSRQLDRPVLDLTGLKGFYDFTLEWAPEAKASAPGDAAGEIGASLFTAVQEQLGLKLEGRKAPIEILVVDRAEKVPTGN
jgi:uncharacterized protein (TIGR03435 family)